MRLLGIFLLFLLTCCSRAGKRVQAQGPFPAAPLMSDYIQFTYAVYLPPGHAGDIKAEVSQAISRHPKTLKRIERLPQRPAEAFVSTQFITDAQKTYTPPSLHSLKYRGVGLSEQEGQALQKSKEAILLKFAHPKASVWTGLRTATLLTEEIARETGGFIFDEETRQVFTPDSWHKHRLESWNAADGVPRLSEQFTIDVYPLGDYHREVTLGLRKMGLPDFMVQEVPETSAGQAATLITSAAQLLAEGNSITRSSKLRLDLRAMNDAAARDAVLKSLKPNALATACVLFKPGRKDEGDPDNRLLELSADLYSGPDPHAKLENLISSLFGFEDTSKKVEHTEELLKESSKEKARLPELQKAFNAGLQPGEYIEVKAPFPTPKGNREWMWVEVTRWRGDRITGTLDNDPAEIPDLHDGQVVEVRQADIFDYIRRFPDGHQEGNTTGAILEKLEQGTEPTMRSKGEMPECN